MAESCHESYNHIECPSVTSYTYSNLVISVQILRLIRWSSQTCKLKDKKVMSHISLKSILTCFQDQKLL